MKSVSSFVLVAALALCGAASAESVSSLGTFSSVGGQTVLTVSDGATHEYTDAANALAVNVVHVSSGTLVISGKGLQQGTVVRVDPGATLDCTGVVGGQTLEALEVDCSTGAGTLKGMVLAVVGKVNILGYSDVRMRDGLSLTLVGGATGSDNLASWRAMADGAMSGIKIFYRNGKIRCSQFASAAVIR